MRCGEYFIPFNVRLMLYVIELLFCHLYQISLCQILDRVYCRTGHGVGVLGLGPTLALYPLNNNFKLCSKRVLNEISYSLHALVVCTKKKTCTMLQGKENDMHMNYLATLTERKVLWNLWPGPREAQWYFNCLHT